MTRGLSARFGSFVASTPTVARASRCWTPGGGDAICCGDFRRHVTTMASRVCRWREAQRCWACHRRGLASRAEWGAYSRARYRDGQRPNVKMRGCSSHARSVPRPARPTRRQLAPLRCNACGARPNLSGLRNGHSPCANPVRLCQRPSRAFVGSARPSWTDPPSRELSCGRHDAHSCVSAVRQPLHAQAVAERREIALAG